jgi:hypothetical protein
LPPFDSAGCLSRHASRKFKALWLIRFLNGHPFPMRDRIQQTAAFPGRESGGNPK